MLIIHIKFCKNCSLGSKIGITTLIRQLGHPVQLHLFFLRRKSGLRIYRLQFLMLSPTAVYFSYRFSFVCNERQT